MQYKDYGEYKDIFKEFGYQVEKRGAIYFFSLLDEVRHDLASGMSDEELREIIPRICLEDYHFYFEEKKSAYFSKLNDFLTTRSNNKNISGIVLEKDVDLIDSTIAFAKYFNAKEEIKEETRGIKK